MHLMRLDRAFSLFPGGIKLRDVILIGHLRAESEEKNAPSFLHLQDHLMYAAAWHSLLGHIQRLLLVQSAAVHSCGPEPAWPQIALVVTLHS